MAPAAEEEKMPKPAPKTEQSEQEDMTNTEILDFIKNFIIKGGVNSVFSLNRMFVRADKDKSGTLSREELNNCLTKLGIQLSPHNFDKLFKLFDTNKDGHISHQEFARTMIGEMNQTRADVVEKVFRRLDKDGDGVIDVNDISGIYDTSKHPDVVSKKKTEKQILAQFLDMFEMNFCVIVSG